MPLRKKNGFALSLFTFTLGASLLVLPTLVFAKDISLKSSISKVMVFPNGAEITRQGDIDISEVGDHVLVLEGLPRHLSPNSLRVEGKTTGDLEIGSVDHKIVYTQQDKMDKTERKALEDEIQTLKDRRDLLDSKIKIASTQKELIEGLTKLPTQSINIHGDDNLNGQQNWGALFDLMGEKLAISHTMLHETRIKRRELSKDIDELLKRLEEQPGKKTRHSVVKINIKVSEAAKGQVSLRYQIRRAGWQPIYDARLTTTEDKPDLTLVRMASIYQHSGESWDNVSLKLSTAQPARGVSAPTLRPLSVEFAPIYQPKRNIQTYGRAMKKSAPMAAAAPEMMEDMVQDQGRAMAKPKMKIARTRKAAVKSQAFQTTFEIAGKVSIKSDGQRKKLKILDDKFSPSLETRTVPKRNTNAYLYANFELPAKATPILPGRLFLFRDGIFVGKGFLPQVGPREKHEMGFGIDDKIKVQYAELKRNKGETGLFTSSKTDKRQFKITVKNLHDKSVNVKVIDQIPYTTDDKIEIELLDSSTKPTTKDAKDKRGILEWVQDIKAGQEQIIKLDYQVSWPSKSDRLIYR